MSAPRERYTALDLPSEYSAKRLRAEFDRVQRGIPHPPCTVDVRDFGVDGRGVHDDSAALQKALDQIPSSGGTLLLRPNGKYAVGTGLIGKSHGTRIIGTGMSGKTVSAATVNGGAQIIGITSGMTVLRWRGVNDDGVTFMQAGPVIEGVGFVDSLGQADQIPGDMTLLEIRVANRWKLINCGFFFGEYGLQAHKDDINDDSADCAQWLIWGSTFTFCLTGAWLNTFTGTVDTSWANGCGTGYLITNNAAANNQQVSGIGIRGCKFDILDADTNTDFPPGIGIDIGLGQNITVSECLFETQPANDAPTTIGINVDGDTNVTRVNVENCFFSNLYTDIAGVTARVLRTQNTITRAGSASLVMNAHIDLDTVVDATIISPRTDGAVTPTITIAGTTTDASVFGFQGSVVGSTTVTGAPISVWKSGSCVWHALNTGVHDFREVASDPSAPNGNHGYLFARDNGNGVTQLAVRFATGRIVRLAAQGGDTVSPAQITADQNDYAPTGQDVDAWRLSSDAARNITGIANGEGGRRLMIVNVGSQNIVLQNENAGSAAANRILTGTGGDVTLAGSDIAMLWYDGTTARWRIINTH